MPRVVSGQFRGTILNSPKGDKTRPTTDKVKEALFSMIQNKLYDIDFLDLFSGSGQIGIEAVSRGAASAVLVDKAGDSIAVIKQNLEKLHFTEQRRKGEFTLENHDDDCKITVMKDSIVAAMTKLGNEGKQFDIIFMDPPYKVAAEQVNEVAKAINEYNLLKKDGILIVEHANDTDLNKYVINLKFNRSCSYGLSVITFFCSL